MTPIVDIDNTVVQVLPFTKRITNWILFVQSVCYPIKWLYSVLKGFINGTYAGNYNVGITYNLGNQVIYNYGLWESLTSGNAGHTPNASPVWWLNVNNSFIGAMEVAHYGGSRLTLEWALNRYFQTTFRQPNDPISPAHSDIYITHLTPVYTSFVSYTTETLTSDVYTNGDSGYSFISEVYAGEASYGFVVHIPVAVYIGINASSAIANTILRQFLDRYVVCGVQYIIVTY